MVISWLRSPFNFRFVNRLMTAMFENTKLGILLGVIWLKVSSFVRYNLMLFCNYVLLLMVSYPDVPTKHVVELLWLVPCYLIIGLAAYFLNDFFDQEQDKKANKVNIAATIHPRWVITWSVILFILGFVFTYWISATACYLLVLQLILLLLYSIPIIRLKERGLIGVITDAIYAHTIPILIVVILFANHHHISSGVGMVLLVVLTSLGIRDILLHQLKDVANDLVSGTQTFAAKNPITASKLVMAATYLIAVALCVLPILIYIDNKQSVFILLSTVMMLFYGYLYMHKRFGSQNNDDVLMRVYIICSSICFLYVLIKQGNYWMTLMLVHPYFIAILIQSGNRVYLAVKWVIKIGLGKLLITYLPLLLNSMMYYCFLLFGRNLKSRPLYQREHEFTLLKRIRQLFQ